MAAFSPPFSTRTPELDRRPARSTRQRSEAPSFEIGDRDVASRAQHLLSTWQLRLPALDVWDSLEATRLEVRARGEWPDWCWMPSEVTSLWAFRCTAAGARLHATLAEVEAWMMTITTPRSERNAHLMATLQLAAAASWRLTRGIYRFDPELQRALLQTPVEELAPEVLLQLPEWCTYIDLDGGEHLAGDRAVGFYAHLDWISRAPDAPLLRLLFVIQREAEARGPAGGRAELVGGRLPGRRCAAQPPPAPRCRPAPWFAWSRGRSGTTAVAGLGPGEAARHAAPTAQRSPA